MEKLVHKLDKVSRKKIAMSYANDKFSQQLLEMSKTADFIADVLINKVKEMLGEKDFCEVVEMMNKFNYRNSFYPDKYNAGVVVEKIHTGKSSHYPKNLSFKIYEKNNFQLVLDKSNDYSYFTNEKKDSNEIYYASFIKNNDMKELYDLDRKYREIYTEIKKYEDICYELLKKVRTAELLMKNWSSAYKYLPEDMEIEEPKTLSLSEKFALL